MKMTFKTVITTILALVMSTVCLAQTDHTFKYVVGHDINSPELRVRMKVAHRNHIALPTLKRFSEDWALGTGQTAGMGLNAAPTVWLNGVSPDCTNDYAVFPVNATPTVGGQANLIVYNQLYSGAGPGLCGAGAATVQAAYAVGTTPLTGDVVPSYSGASAGQKIAILETANAKLHIVTVGTGGTATASVAPTETVVDYTNITVTNCSGGTVHTATKSNVWIDYGQDVAYVGDDNGRLYAITGVFNGTPTLSFCTSLVAGDTIGLPVVVSSGGTTYVFAVANGEFLYRVQVNPAKTAFTGKTNLRLGKVANSIFESPVYDVGASMGYVWSNSDNINGTNQSALFQVNILATPMTVAFDLGLGVAMTVSGDTGIVMDGYFDNTWLTSGAGASGATGYTPFFKNGVTGSPAMASFQFNASGVITGLTAMNDNTNINPSTGTVNGNIVTYMITSYDSTAGVDQLFVSTGNGTTSNASSLKRFVITTPLVSNGATASNTVNTYPGGTGALIIDWQDSGLGNQTQNLYFGNLAQPTSSLCGGLSVVGPFYSCNVKAQQSNLN